jgi:leucine dehydrogenase
MTLKVEVVEASGYHRVLHGTNSETGLDAVVAVHNTILGTALGGCRIMQYDSYEEQLIDALALSKGMTYKNSLAGLNLGGGKTTINTHGKPVTEELLASFGEFMDYVNKDRVVYITAGDVGSGPEVTEVIAKYTDFIQGAVGSDSGWATAYGVYNGMLGALRFNNQDIKNKHIAINGLGKVGARLARFLIGAGARITVADINEEQAQRVADELGGRCVPYTEIHKVECDIYSPCAVGGAINSQTVGELRCKIVCGGANNQLATPDMMSALTASNILYVPDYLANSGGVIIVSTSDGGKLIDLEYHTPEVVTKLNHICDVTMEVLRQSAKYNSDTAKVAELMAERRLVAY